MQIYLRYHITLTTSFIWGQWGQTSDWNGMTPPPRTAPVYSKLTEINFRCAICFILHKCGRINFLSRHSVAYMPISQMLST